MQRLKEDFPLKAAIYARTNTVDQSTFAQIKLCREYVLESGGQVVGIFDDIGVSSHEPDRDGLRELMRNATEGVFDTVVVNSYDRLFRDQAQFNEFLSGLRQLGIELVVVKRLNRDSNIQ